MKRPAEVKGDVLAPTRENMLLSAARYYESGQVKLLQGAWGSVESGQACLTEVLAHAARELHYSPPDVVIDFNTCFCGLCFGDVLALDAGFTGAEEAWAFNDAEGRTEDEVAFRLRKAAQ